MKIKKIMLIRPGFDYPEIKTPKRFEMPLGALYLISTLRQNFPNQFEIDLFEKNLYKLSLNRMRERIKKFNPDLVGFSCLSVEADEMAEIARIVKEINPNCITLLGGPHATVFYDRALKNADIDIAIIGEGEQTFTELLKKLLASEPIEQVKGIAFRKDGKIILAPPREPIEGLDSIPFPAWDLIDFKRYSKKISMNIFTQSASWASIFTSRGCPFHCAYCHNIFGKRTRFRSPENVIAEIELLTKKYGVKEIHIVDDIFNLDLGRAKRICDLIIERGIKIKIAFPNGVRGDMMDRELIHKLKQAGCYSITYAIETASPRIQKLIHKNLDLDKVSKAISWAREEKITTRGFFMLGFPTETPEELEMTVKWALNSKLSAALFMTVVIYPRIELMKIAKRAYPNFDFDKWDRFKFHYRAKTPFYTQATGINLFRIQTMAFRHFYYRPKIIFSTLCHIPKNFSPIRYGFQYLFFRTVGGLPKISDSMKEKIYIIIMIILTSIFLKNIVFNILSYRYLKF